MFGDIGHGSVLFLVGIVLTLFKEKLEKLSPVMGGVLKARYLLLLMGMFATFSGIVYNDFMAIPIFASWGSCYHIENHHDGHGHVHKKAILKEDCVYPIGIDPVWYLSSNELTFMNSLKMKISVILGVMQMALGVCMKAFNARFFNN